MNSALTKHPAWINEIFEALDTPDHVDKQEVNTQQNFRITIETSLAESLSSFLFRKNQ